jgi:hypothetical protein
MIYDAETRQALIAICELLKTQAAYFSNLQTSASALLYTLIKTDPSLEKRYDAERLQTQGLPGSDALLRKVDALLEQLKNSN